MSDFLTEMSEASSLRARVTREGADATGIQDRAASGSPPLALDLSPGGFDVIAEAKLASPSEGRLVAGPPSGDQVMRLAAAYAEAGAAAVSILTEETHFAGSLQHLETVAASVAVPVLRKDFLVDPIQVVEARAAGASGVLLIARLLPGELLVEMTDLAIAYGMFVLVEVFDTSDLKNAVRVFDRDVLVGVNCRDLMTLEIERERFETIAPHLPDHLPAVAESGITTPDDVARVASLGYRMALVGSSLVSDVNPTRKLETFIAAGRDTVTGARR